MSKSTKHFPRHRKIHSLAKLRRLIEPHRATLVGSSFDPLDTYYLDLLRLSALKFRPLVVLVQTDRVVRMRRGLRTPERTQHARAAAIAKLPFVDFAFVSSRVAHDPVILTSLKPRCLVLQRDHPIYLRALQKEIKKRFPRVHVMTAPLRRPIPRPARAPFPIASSDHLFRRLLSLARHSKAPIGKISALLLKDGKVIAQAANSSRGEHAELIILKKLSRNGADTLLVLIPPCIGCAKAIVRRKLKRVEYVYRYGDMFGAAYLKSKGVVVKHYRAH